MNESHLQLTVRLWKSDVEIEIHFSFDCYTHRIITDRLKVSQLVREIYLSLLADSVSACGYMVTK